MARFTDERLAQKESTEQQSLNVSLSDKAWQRIDSLVQHQPIDGTAEQLVTLLLDQLQQAVGRQGSWEREPYESLFGSDVPNQAAWDVAEPEGMDKENFFAEGHEPA